MSDERKHGVGCEEVVPTVAVGDVAAALEWYTSRLGFTELWRWGDPPAHAAVCLGSAEVHLSRTEPNPGGFWLHFVVDDVDAYHERLVGAGVTPEHPPEDQQWDMREMAVVDPVGNQMTFASPRMAQEPKIPVTRVDVPLRLESRMAAVLRDLADHKGMSPSELLEETLLHTFEPWKDGVASPHTAADLRRIQELKEEHGLDYGVHGSYRFEEVGEDGR